MSLATRCTACGTAFRVVQDQLKVSGGWVRCGQCREVFNAVATLFDLERDGEPGLHAPPAGASARATTPAHEPREVLPERSQAPATPAPRSSDATSLTPASSDASSLASASTDAPAAEHPSSDASSVASPSASATPSQSSSDASPAATPADPAAPVDDADEATDSTIDGAVEVVELDVAEAEPTEPMALSEAPAEATPPPDAPAPSEAAADSSPADVVPPLFGAPRSDAVTDSAPPSAAPEPAELPATSQLLAFASLEDDDESPVLPGLASEAARDRDNVPSLYAELDESAPRIPADAAFLAPEPDGEADDDTIRLPDVAGPPAVRDPDIATDEWAVEAAHDRPSDLEKKVDEHLFGKRRHARRHAPAVHVSARDQLDFSDARFDSNLLAEEELAGAPHEDPAAEPASTEPPIEPLRKPEFLRRADRAARWQRPSVRAALATAGVALAALLVLQGAHHFRDDLAARSPSLQPLLAAWCRLASCTLEAPRHLEDITVESTALARASGDAFRLAVTLRNHGGTALALPAVDLSLTDGAGRLVARRALTARDFKANPPVLPAHGEVQLQAPIAARNGRVSGYTVEIFYP